MFVGESLQAKLHKKLFRKIWGDLGKILRTPKFACSYTYDENQSINWNS